MQAIFFDFDGVIVESAEIKVEAFRQLYADQSPEIIDAVVAYHKAHEGISRVLKIRHCHETFLNTHLSEGEHEALCRAFSENVEEKVIQCESVDGALALLIRAREIGLNCYVVSGTPEDELKRITAKRGISSYFAGIYGSPRKKEDIVDEVLEQNGYMASDCLFVGDAMTDYDAAKACEVPFIGRVGPGDENPFPEGSKIVPNLSELAQVLGLINQQGTLDDQ